MRERRTTLIITTICGLSVAIAGGTVIYLATGDSNQHGSEHRKPRESVEHRWPTDGASPVPLRGTSQPKVSSGISATPSRQWTEIDHLIEKQRRLDARLAQLEQRVARFERLLGEARLAPVAEAEYDLILRDSHERLTRLRAQLDREYKEVGRLALTLSVPERLTRLPMNEVRVESQSHLYEAYFGARSAAEGTQGLVDAAERSLAEFMIKNSAAKER